MSFWSCIGEFLLFRWLFDDHESDCNGNVGHTDYGGYSGNDDYIDYGSRQSDDFLDEQDDYDMMDDDF